jgi:DNA-binding beta-propeller fold protein YncE
MSAYFFGITDRIFTYSQAIGRTELAGPGFRIPVDLALGDGDTTYVVNRTAAARREGARITKCTFTEEYITQFGSYGSEEGQFVWPASIAIDRDQNLYVVDEWLNRVSVFTQNRAPVGPHGCRR